MTAFVARVGIHRELPTAEILRHGLYYTYYTHA